jgi:hypothetical protein
MARYYEPITIQEFEEKLKSAVHKYHMSECPDPDINDYYEPDAEGFADNSYLEDCHWMEVNAALRKDLSKIEFCDGNVCLQHDNLSLLGINTFPNGMPYLGMLLGGDWEASLFVVVYWDGKQLRGYIPEDGNCFNYKTRTAFGNGDDDEEIQELKLRGYSVHTVNDSNFSIPFYLHKHFKWDADALTKDITSRIVLK